MEKGMEIIGKEIVSHLFQVPPVDYHGKIYWWDLDNTYLLTNHERFIELLKIPFESAEEKISVPGASALIRELRVGPVAEQPEKNYLYFLTSSPPQLSRSIEEKLKLDKVQYDGIIYKDVFKSIAHGKFRLIKKQIGFKLGTLLGLLSTFPKVVNEIFFGDDTQDDPFIYALYHDISRGGLTGDQLLTVLDKFKIREDDKDLIVYLATNSPRSKRVDRIYIHLAKSTDPKRFDCFGGLVIPVYDYFQAALHLFQERKISLQGIVNVGLDLINNFGFDIPYMVKTFTEFYLRGCLTDETVFLVQEELCLNGLMPKNLRFKIPFKTKFKSWCRDKGFLKEFESKPLITEKIDYIHHWDRVPMVN